MKPKFVQKDLLYLVKISFILGKLRIPLFYTQLVDVKPEKVNLFNVAKNNSLMTHQHQKHGICDIYIVLSWEPAYIILRTN